jgi:hypothetical protein
MASITITIPDDKAQRVLDAFAGTFGWVDVATSGSKAAFAKQKLIDYIRDTTLGYEQVQQEATVRAATPPVAPIDGVS